MKKSRIPPGRDRLIELIDYNPETGTFIRACDRKAWKKGEPMGTLAGGYLSINIDMVIYRAHRLAWVIMTGQEPPKTIDHINGNPLDNRWCNLRAASQAEQCINKRVQSNNKLGVKGVHKIRSSGRFRALVHRNGKRIDLGCFGTIEEAKAAYDAAALILHGEFFRS